MCLLLFLGQQLRPCCFFNTRSLGLTPAIRRRKLHFMSRQNQIQNVSIRLLKNKEVVLDEIFLPVVVASTPAVNANVSVIIEAPPAHSTKKVDGVKLILSAFKGPPANEKENIEAQKSSKEREIAIYRLASVIWLSSLYRKTNTYTPAQFQRIVDWVFGLSAKDFCQFFGNGSSSHSFMIAVVQNALPEANSIPESIPHFPFHSVSTLYSSLILSATNQLSTIGFGLTVEATKATPSLFLDSPSASLHATVQNTLSAVQWLLEESKLHPRNKFDEKLNGILSRSIFSLAALSEAADAAVSASRIEIKEYIKSSNASPPNYLTVTRCALLLAGVACAQCTYQRCVLVLLPLLRSRAIANQSREIALWPQDKPAMPDVPIPNVNQIVNETAIQEFEKQLGLIQSLLAYTDWNCSLEIESIEDKLTQAADMAVKLSVLEIGMSTSLLEDDEVESYNNAVAKVLKKKENVSSKIHFGKPLQKFISEIRPLKTTNASIHDFLSTKCISGGILSLQGCLADCLTPTNQGSRKPKVAKGALDTDPQRMVIRDHVLTLVRSVFNRYGAVPIETPIFELRETLIGKYGEDQKLIFDLKDQGGEQLSLRYDLTVPFARYCATNNVERIKRFHIGKVYRRDEPQMSKGRFREFYQCDFDIAGEYDMMVADAEAISALVDILKALEGAIGAFEIKLNHRRLLDAIMAVCEVPVSSFRPICSAIDKLDKLSWDEVKREMCETKGLEAEVADRLLTYVELRGKPMALLKKLNDMQVLRTVPGCEEILNQLETLFTYLEASGADQYVVFDLSLARGLDYYTGVIYEAVLIGQSLVGSVGAGGRYDKLVGMFSGKDIPAVGVSIGVERLFRIVELNLGIVEIGPNDDLLAKGKSKCNVKKESRAVSNRLRENKVDVFVCSIGEKLLCDRIRVCKRLRDAGIAADFMYGDKIKLVKQMTYANDQGIPLAVIFGQDELDKKTIKLRHFVYDGDANAGKNKEEKEVLLENLVEAVQAALQMMNSSQNKIETLIDSCQSVNSIKS